MEIVVHKNSAELIAEKVVLTTPQDALDIMMEAVYAGSRKLILHRANIAPEFFDLKSGLAGEVLQKAVNYQVQLAIVGDFTDIQSESFQAFVRECNRGNDMVFVSSVQEAKEKLI